MKLTELTLTTDKSTAQITDDTRIIRQSERGQVLPVVLLDETAKPYNLTGLKLQFNELKNGDKIVIDDGDPASKDAGKFNIIDAVGGKFEYTLQRQVYAEDGVAYFSIMNGSDVVDTTMDFYFKVEKAPVINIGNDNYASSMEAELNRLKAEAKRVSDTIAGYGDDVKGQVDKIGQTASDEFAKSVQAMKDQLASFSQGLSDYSDEFAKLKDGWNADFNTDQASLHKDYEAWKQQQLDSFNNQVQPIKDALSKSQTQADSITQQTQQAVNKVDKLMSDLSGYDFTQFIKPSDLENYYNKSETDKLISNAGKVKTVNGNQPDGNGNVQIPIPSIDGLAKTTDLENYYSKSKIDEKLSNLGDVKGAKINEGNLITPDSQGVLDLPIPSPDLSSYAKTTSVTDLSNRVSKLEQNTNSGGLQLKQASSRSDAETKSKNDQNSIYYFFEE